VCYPNQILKYSVQYFDNYNIFCNGHFHFMKWPLLDTTDFQYFPSRWHVRWETMKLNQPTSLVKMGMNHCLLNVTKSFRN
jgi:hypothetical protein